MPPSLMDELEAMGGRGNGRAVARRDDNAPPDWKGGRNDPFWCGSGQKYEKRHGK